MANDVTVKLQEPIRLMPVKPSSSESERHTARRLAVEAVLELVRAKAQGGGQQHRIYDELEELSTNADLIQKALLLENERKAE